MRKRVGNRVPGDAEGGFVRRTLAPALLTLGAVILVLAAGAVVSPAARAQERATPKGGAGQVSKISSDRMRSTKANGRTIRHLYGNVVIDRDTLVAEADTAREYVESDIFILRSNVKITRREAVLYCDRAIYTRGEGRADFFGNIRLIDGDMTGTGLRGEIKGDGRHVRLIDEAVLVTPDHTVTADTIYQDRAIGLGMAMGNVRIVGKLASPGAAAATADTAAADSAAADSAAAGQDSLAAAPDTSGAPVPADSLAAAEPDTTPQVLTCKRAVFRNQGEESDFYWDVRIEDGEVIGTSRKAEVRQGGRIMRLIGDALLVAPEYTIRADTIFQDRDTDQGEAFGNVRIVEPEARNMVTGDHAVFDKNGGTATVDVNPVLTSREQSGGPFTGRSGWMQFLRDEDKVVMVDSVRIHQDRTEARADTAVAYGRHRMVLTGKPEVLLGEKSRMTGEAIEFQYADGHLRQVRMMGQAVMEDSTPDSLAAIYQGLPALDVLEGDTITVEFEDDQIQRTVVLGNGRSHYTPTDIDDEIATNDVTGDTIIIYFRDERVRRVDVYGNVSGTYKFARIAEMRDMMTRSARRDSLLAALLPDSLAGVDSLGALLPAGVAWQDSALNEYLRPYLATLPDSLKSLLPDTLSVAGLDSVMHAGSASGRAIMNFIAAAEDVDYSGREIRFEMGRQTMEINGDGKLDYGTMEHTARHIVLNTATRELYSEGEPYLKDNDAVVGERMGYNFKHKTGAVQSGVTSFDGYYYLGESIRRYPDETMKICGGNMTSCDLAEPHYHFWSHNMKMRQGDKVVAAPIVLKIGQVPVFALPFYFKSLKQGRQSGILFPSFDFGWSSREGRYIRDFGYYWATNDYLDFIVEGDYNERQDFAFRVSNRYIKRYTFNGTVDFTRQIGLNDANRTREWQFVWGHNQPTLFDDYKFRADVRMSSSSLSSNDLTGSNTRDIVSGQMKSNVYLSRNWDLVSANLNATRDGRVNAEDDDPGTDNLIYSLTLPSLSLNFRQFTLARQLKGGQKGNFFGDLLRNTYVQHSYSLKSDRKHYELTDVTRYNANGKASVSLRPPRVGIFNVSLSANAGQDWFRETTEGRAWVEDSDSTGHYDPVYERNEETRPNLSFSTNLGTTLYGLFPVHVGRLQTIRHTTKLGATWNVTPAIPDKQRHGTTLSLSWDNRLDVKYLADAGDSTTVKKLDGLLDWGLSTSYNPKKEPGDRWGDISSNLTVKPGQSRYLQLKVSNSIDPKNLALKSTRFNYSLNFAGRLDTGAVGGEDEDMKNEAVDKLGTDKKKDKDKQGARSDDPFARNQDSAFNDYAQRKTTPRSSGTGRDETEGGRYLPFKINSSISYSYTNSTRDKRANVNFGVQANLTRSWQFRYDTSYDLAIGQPVRQQFSLTRDLHCWALEFNRTLSDVDSQFGFRLYLKSIPALKFVRGREDNLGGLGEGLGGGLY
ncbi:hypothetical protein KJ682_16375 [bacterium]|nr:hypothetical protein [bacterium]